jgi:hypothetical protein
MEPLLVLNVLQEVAAQAKNRDLQVTIHAATRAALITGGATLVGALMLGPAGIMIGAVGGAAASLTIFKNFKPIPQIILEMSPEERQALATIAIQVAAKRNLDLLSLTVVDYASEPLREWLQETFEKSKFKGNWKSHRNE